MRSNEVLNLGHNCDDSSPESFDELKGYQSRKNLARSPNKLYGCEPSEIQPPKELWWKLSELVRASFLGPTLL